MREILVLTSEYARTSVQILEEEEGSTNRTQQGDRECHLFWAGNRAVLLGNQRFSWREIAAFEKEVSLKAKSLHI